MIQYFIVTLQVFTMVCGVLSFELAVKLSRTMPEIMKSQDMTSHTMCIIYIYIYIFKYSGPNDSMFRGWEVNPISEFNKLHLKFTMSIFGVLLGPSLMCSHKGWLMDCGGWYVKIDTHKYLHMEIHVWTYAVHRFRHVHVQNTYTFTVILMYVYPQKTYAYEMHRQKHIQIHMHKNVIYTDTCTLIVSRKRLYAYLGNKQMYISKS